MTAQLRIGRLTLRGTAEAEPLLRSMEPRPDDRRVLIIRRLTIEQDDPLVARDQVAGIRRSAAHPARGGVVGDAVAVEFSDEVEALSCLSQDLLAGTAREHWWWLHRLPSPASSPGADLAAVWWSGPRLVPAVLADLEAGGPGAARSAVTMLGPRAEHVLAAVAAQFPAQYRSAVDRLPQPSGPEADAYPAVELLIAVAATVTGSAALLRQSGPRDIPATVDAAPSTNATGAPTSPGRPDRDPDPAGVTEADALPTASSPAPTTGVTAVPATSGDKPDHAHPEHQLPTEVADLDSERRRRRSTPATTGAYAESEWYELDTGEPALPPWLGSGPELESRLATMLYVVNLMRWFALDELAEPPATGWAVVEALVRALLDELAAADELADDLAEELAEDPLLPLLVRLDGRDPATPNPVVFGDRFDAVRSWLDDHDVGLTTFARPGGIYASRTHIDVVLPLSGIDLTARISGLDQDPGWVPELARIVLFHFRDV